MNKKQIIAAVSSSALASGMAHGAILNSGPVNYNLPCEAGTTSSTAFDMNGDGIGDFLIGFDGDSSPPNNQKPYIQGFPFNSPGSTVLVGSNQDNLPVTPFGTLINTNYLGPTVNSTGQGYFDQEFDDQNAHYVGGWNTGAITEGYVGMELWDGNGNTNFGWVLMIYDGVDAPNSLTVVDYAYETTPFAGIIAGQTNDYGIPTPYSEPQPQTVGLGADVQFSITILADPPPAYQWQVGPASGLGPYTPLTDGGVISGSTNATLTINGATAANQGDYRVVVTNSLGAYTSSVAPLVVVSPVATPTPQVLFGGLTATFSVNVASGLSPTYQWQMNGTNLSDGGRIAGSKTSLLKISDLQASDAANYDVVLNVSSLLATSTVASLTVLPVSEESIYDTAVLADGPVAYYRLNESGNPANGNLLAYDNAGAFNGIYGIDVTNAYDGASGPDPAGGFAGFAANNAAVIITPDDTNCWITLAPWNLNTNSVTFTAWVNPSAEPNPEAAIVYTGTTNYTDAGMNYYFEDTGNGMQLSYAWDQGLNNDEYQFFQSGLYTPDDEWSFVAVAITSSNATLYVFNIEGTNSVTDESYLTNASFDPNGSTNLVMPFNNPEYIGSSPNANGATPGADNFTGSIADVAIFNQTLTSNQLQTLYSAALGVSPPPSLGITAVGTNIQITWTSGSLQQATNLSGPWKLNSTTSPYTVAPSGSMFYRAVAP